MSFLSRMFLAAAMVLAAPAARAEEPASIAIVGADVLPMTGDQKLIDQTVLIAGDRIVAVGPRGEIRLPAGARRIDAEGLTLMPGLVDMHVHLAPTPGEPGDAAQRALAVMLGHGVTTARGMAGSPNNLVVRDKIERGEIMGPRLYAAAPAFNLNSVKSPAEARAGVAAAKAAGYDLIKSHHLTDLAVWQALQDEARKQEMPVAGHVANQVGLARALAAKQQVEHLDGALLALLPAEAPERLIDFAQIPPPPVMQAVAGTSDAAVKALAASMAAADNYQVPTLALFEKLMDLDTPTAALIRAPEMRYVPQPALQQWAAQREQLLQAGFTASDAQTFRDIRRRLVRAFHEAGVPIMAGSDTAQAFHIWGPGLIEEIEALAVAGLPPMAALKSATVVPRDYFRSLPNSGSSLGWKADFGTVEPGARADLILLDGDPAHDLSALRRLRAVVAAGNVHDRAALDAMLDKAAADVAKVQTQ